MIAALTLSSVAMAQGSNVECPYKANKSVSQVSDQKSKVIVASLLGSQSIKDSQIQQNGSATR